MDRRTHTRMTGQAGVYRVASELLFRGFNPSFPAVDWGADIVIDGGIRIQVKSSHMSMRGPYKGGAYWFKMQGRTHYLSGCGNIREIKPRIFSSECDFVVLFGIEESRFWITPAALFDESFLVVMGSGVGTQFKQVDHIAVLADRETGMTCEEIGKKHNVSRKMIERIISGKRETWRKGSNPRSVEVRTYESRWDIIEEAYNLIRQVDGEAIPETVSVEE